MGEKKIDVLLAVRGMAQAMAEAARMAGVEAEFVASPEQAAEWLKKETREGDVVLMKASRGVKLEQALHAWENSVAIPSDSPTQKGTVEGD